MIPKIVHYCWFGKKDKPASVKKYIETWKAILPDYEIKEWNEDNFPIDRIKFTSEAYSVGKYAFVADVARLHALEKEGGIYLDTDIEVVRSFDDLLARDYFIGYEHFGTIGTGVIGASKGIDFIKGFLNTYYDKPFIKFDGTYNDTPNSSLLMKYINDNHLDIDISKIDYFCAKNYQTGKIERTCNTYCIHHYSASWKPWYARFEMRLCNILGIRYRDFLFRYFGK